MILQASLLFALLGCKAVPPTPTVDDQPVTVRIVAMNDFHGALYELPVRKNPQRVTGGLPWLKGALDVLRAEDPELILLDGGDLFQGTWPVNATDGMGSVQAFNLLGVDAAAVGNHEFDYGGKEGGHALRGALEAAAQQAEFQWLSSNITHKDSGEPWQVDGIQATTLIERKGKKIGVIGLSTMDTPQTTLTANVADLSFVDPVERVRELAPALRAQGADAIVIVGHLTGKCEPTGAIEPPGEDCMPTGEIGRLLTELAPGTVDVIVAGHAHTLLANRIGDTFVLENRSKGAALGQVELVFGPDGLDIDASRIHKPWGLFHDPSDPGCEEGEFNLTPQTIGDRLVTPDPAALQLIDKLEAQAGSLCDELACNETHLGRSRTAESALGNWVSDAMLSAFEGTDIAIQNAGGLRTDLPAGKVRREHLQQVMPFDNRLFLVEMTGQQVELMFRIGSAGAHGLLQVSGATYHFDPTVTEGSDINQDGQVEAWETNRLCSISVGDAPLDPKGSYKVVTTDFLLGGGDHLTPAFKDTTVVGEGPLLRDHLGEVAAQTAGCIGAQGALLDSEQPRIQQGACEG